MLRQKITVVHIGIPEGKIKRTEEGRRKSGRNLVLKNNEIVIGSLSRLVEFKGHHFLLKAFNGLINKRKIDAS